MEASCSLAQPIVLRTITHASSHSFYTRRCVPFKKPKKVTETYKIILRHYIIGLAITVVIFWMINEIPGIYYFEEHLTEWIATLVAIPVIGLFMAKILSNRLKRTNGKLYLFSTWIILLTWVLILYFKAAIVGIVTSIDQVQFKFLDSIIGFTIYQLWIFLGLGIIHGVIGGIFLSIDLKKNRPKLKTSHNNI
ncbi:hypothetical protein ACKGJN_13365 [Gillisia sp. Q332]|uniref:hypothetical protein n=1 Tax=Gillisia xinjiangensis TaxID=3384765 RepID=UPI00391C8AC6